MDFANYHITRVIKKINYRNEEFWAKLGDHYDEVMFYHERLEKFEEIMRTTTRAAHYGVIDGCVYPWTIDGIYVHHREQIENPDKYLFTEQFISDLKAFTEKLEQGHMTEEAIRHFCIDVLDRITDPFEL